VQQALVTALEQAHPPTTRTGRRGRCHGDGPSQAAIGRIWRAFGRKPHLVQPWRLSADPRFIDKVRDIVGRSLAPPATAVVLGVDKTSRLQALERTAPTLPDPAHHAGPAPHDDVRHATPARSPRSTWPAARSAPGCTSTTAISRW
jgi:hypothetical protein